MQIKLFTIQLILLTLFGIEAFNQGMIFFIGLVGILLLEVFVRRQYWQYICREECLLILSFTIGFLTMLAYDRATLSPFYMFRVWIGPIMGYFIGKAMGCGKEKHLATIAIIIGMSTMLHGVLNLYRTETLYMSKRYLKDFWSGSLVSATLQGTYFAMASAIAGYCIFLKSSKIKILGGCIIAIVLYNAMQTATRSPLYLLGIVLVIAYIIRMVYAGVKSAMLTRLMKLVAGAIAIILVLATIYQTNMFDLRPTFESSQLGKRLYMINTEQVMTRQKLWETGLKLLLQNPMGYSQRGYAHNLWIDWGRSAGWLPAILLVAYTWCICTMLLKIIRKQRITKEMAYLIVLIYVACLISFAIEPILDAVPLMFIKFCIINGAVASIGTSNKPYCCGTTEE